MPLKILIVDDEEPARQGLTALLGRWGYDVDEAADGQEALAKAAAGLPSVVLSDLVMPKMDGLDLLRALKTDVPFASVILLTGQGSIDTAVTAMREGAYDYLTKPVDVARLRVLIPKAAERGEALRDVALLRRKLSQVWGMGRLVGTSHGMQEVYRLIEVAAPTPAAVLISGESGTGKELVARTLHELSPRAKGPFVAVNCAAIPETLLESEIFGHEKGAFTGALERRPGCFELAHEGTIFLDEIAEMNPGTQAKFLRILQDGTVRRLGGKTEIKVDVRVLAATNKDPVKAIQEGTFREDLYYRLNVVSLALPPLRERRDDIPALVQAFIEEFNARYDKRIRSVDESVLNGLIAQGWPGNVRELRNTLERAIIVCDGDTILPRHMPPAPALRSTESADGPDSVSFRVGTSLDDAEKALILKTLAANANNKTRAADVLGISLKTLHNKLKAYGS
ncbi:MAG TPA: sigma-54 dependent transcriptional regulator [Methylomirabilota bacterium]|jgi:DNA-binding NtrC family response regulator|nr:sigma-54 dependent transcriptional regulator [Methylomirabilota bacterium]